MYQHAKILILLWLLMILVGGGLLLFGKIPFLGKLPGDIHIQKKSFDLFFPIVTCLVISFIFQLWFQSISFGLINESNFHNLLTSPPVTPSPHLWGGLRGRGLQNKCASPCKI